MAKKLKLLERANVSEHYLFSWKVFASWDYAITEASTAVGKKKQIAIALKVHIIWIHELNGTHALLMCMIS